MVQSNTAIGNTVGGELSPLMFGRADLPIYKRGVSRAQNFIALPHGAARYRSGFTLIHTTRGNRKAVLIPFQFNDQQSYVIEATLERFRFHKDNGVILESAKAITGVTQGVTTTITCAGHGYTNGNEILISGISGTTELNGRYFLVASAALNTFQITDIFGTAVNSSGYGAYVSGGTAERIYEINTPYLEADLEGLQFAQTHDTMYITHQGYAPRKLTRSGHASWSLSTYVRTSDPFTSSTKWPRAVAFTDDGRLVMGGTIDNPETIFGSKAPSGGSTNFDDFTLGTNATDAIQFTLAPIHGKADSIQWLVNTDKFLLAGTFGTVRRMFGAGESDPISATNITAKSVNTYGCAMSLPVSNGTSVFYLQRGKLVLRSFEYDYVTDGYMTTDRNIVSDHITRPGIIRLVNQQGRPEILWAVRKDGVFLGLTYKDKEDISGWHRHHVGGQHVNDNNILRPWGKVLSAAPMPREDADEQIWVVVERYINERTIRTVEYMSDHPAYPVQEDFYTGTDNKIEDTEKYTNAKFESQKAAVHVDMAITYDGSVYGTSANANITPAAVSGASVAITASAAVFTASMVGRQIWKKYDENGNGGGRAEIIGYTNPTQITVKIKSPFDSTDEITAGNWYLTATTLSGLDLMTNTEVTIIADGGQHNSKTVVNGAITLDAPASVVHVGYGYTGILKTLNLDMGGVTGSAQSKKRNVSKTAIRFLDSVGASFGTDLYRLQQLRFRRTSDKLSRPTPLFSGVHIETYEDSWDIEKNVIVVQEAPLPCTVLVLDVFAETTDE